MQTLVNNNNGEVRNVQQDSGIANEDANCTIINEYAPRSNFINKKLNTLPYSGLATVFLGYDNLRSVRQEICDSTQQVSDIENGLSDLFCSKSTKKIINLDNYNYVGTISKSSSYSIILDITSNVLIVGKNSYIESFSGYYQYLKAYKVNPAASSYDYNNRYYKLENLTLCDENNTDKSKYIDTNNYFIQCKSDYTNSSNKQIALISGSNLKSIKSFFNFSFIFPFTTTDIEMTNWKFAYNLKDNGVRKIPIISSLHSDDDIYSDNLYFIDSNTMTVNELIESNESLKSDIEQLESQEHSEYQYYERRLIGSKSTEYFTNDQIITGKFYIYGFYPYDYQVNEGMESYKSGIERMVLTSELKYYTVKLWYFTNSVSNTRTKSLYINKGTTLTEIADRTAENNGSKAINVSLLSTILARFGIYSSYDEYHYAFEYCTDLNTIHEDQTEEITNDINLDIVLDVCNTAFILCKKQTINNTKINVAIKLFRNIKSNYSLKNILNNIQVLDSKTYHSYIAYVKDNSDKANVIFLSIYINKYNLQFSKDNNYNYPSKNSNTDSLQTIIESNDIIESSIDPNYIINTDNRTAVYIIGCNFANKVTAYAGTKDNPTATGFLVEGLTIRSCLLDATNELSYNEGTPWSQDLLLALLPDFDSTILELSGITAKAYKSDGTYDEITDLDHVVSSDYSYYEISVLN